MEDDMSTATPTRRPWPPPARAFRALDQCFAPPADASEGDDDDEVATMPVQAITFAQWLAQRP
jgi:hypothetical protein